VLEAWCTSLEALALTRERSSDAPACVTRAERLARSTASPGPTAVAALAGALVSGIDAERAGQYVSELGLAVGDVVAPVSMPAGKQLSVGAAPSLTITVFGQFSIAIGGLAVDLTTAKPRVRSLLRLLASQAGRPVHRERLIDALWPDADAETGTRNLQVAISALRQVLEPGVARGESALLRREGDAYFLALDERSSVDALQLLQATAAGQEALRTGDQDRAIAAFDRALELYVGEMIPEEGPAEWLHDERESYRTAIVEAAFALAGVHAARGELVAGAFACERGLRVDRYRDSLWRLLIELYERGGETAAAARSREQYRAVLSELGVEPDATP
jgi:DNA-binding SARP family transcriptional activator